MLAMGKAMAEMQSRDSLISFVRKVTIKGWDWREYINRQTLEIIAETEDGRKISFRTTGKMTAQEIVDKIIKELKL